jgi:hypothetical protein
VENTSLVAESAKGRAAGGIGDLANLQRADMPMQACASLCGGESSFDRYYSRCGLFRMRRCTSEVWSLKPSGGCAAKDHQIACAGRAGPEHIVRLTWYLTSHFFIKISIFNNDLRDISSNSSPRGNGYGNRMQISQTS